jgi:hypothetical protein
LGSFLSSRSPDQLSAESYRREIGLKDIRLEGDHEVAIGQFRLGQVIAVEGQAVGFEERLHLMGLVHDMTAPKGLGHTDIKVSQGPRFKARPEGHFVGASLPSFSQRRTGTAQGIGPRYLAPPPFAPDQGRLDAFGTVGAQQASLASQAQGAAIDGMVRVSFQLDRSSLPYAHQQTTTGWAFPAD